MLVVILSLGRLCVGHPRPAVLGIFPGHSNVSFEFLILLLLDLESFVVESVSQNDSIGHPCDLLGFDCFVVLLFLLKVVLVAAALIVQAGSECSSRIHFRMTLDDPLPEVSLLHERVCHFADYLLGSNKHPLVGSLEAFVDELVALLVAIQRLFDHFNFVLEVPNIASGVLGVASDTLLELLVPLSLVLFDQLVLPPDGVGELVVFHIDLNL